MDIFLEVLALAAEFAAWIALALLLAYMAESTTEFFIGLIFKYLPENVKKYSELVLSLVAAGVGLYLCYHYQVDLVYVLTAIASKVAGQEPIIALSGTGIFMTGLGVGRGASYIHDLIKKHTSGKPVPIA